MVSVLCDDWQSFGDLERDLDRLDNLVDTDPRSSSDTVLLNDLLIREPVRQEIAEMMLELSLIRPSNSVRLPPERMRAEFEYDRSEWYPSMLPG